MRFPLKIKFNDALRRAGSAFSLLMKVAADKHSGFVRSEYNFILLDCGRNEKDCRFLNHISVLRQENR